MSDKNKKNEDFFDGMREKLENKIAELEEKIEEEDRKMAIIKNERQKEKAEKQKDKPKTGVRKLSKKYLITVFCAILTFASVVTLVAFFGGSIMGIFGFEYENPYTLILFFLAVSVFSAPFQFFLDTTRNILIKEKRMSAKIGEIVFSLSDISITFIIMNLVDKIMVGIRGTSLSFIVISILMMIPYKEDIFKKPTL